MHSLRGTQDAWGSAGPRKQLSLRARDVFLVTWRQAAARARLETKLNACPATTGLGEGRLSHSAQGRLSEARCLPPQPAFHGAGGHFPVWLRHPGGGAHSWVGVPVWVWVEGFAPSPHLGESLVPSAEDPAGWRRRSPEQLWVVGRGPLWLPRGRELLCGWAGCTPGLCTRGPSSSQSHRWSFSGIVCQNPKVESKGPRPFPSSTRFPFP